MQAGQSAGSENRADGVANHLRTHGRKLFPQLFVGQVMKSDSIPSARLLNQRRPMHCRPAQMVPVVRANEWFAVLSHLCKLVINS